MGGNKDDSDLLVCQALGSVHLPDCFVSEFVLVGYGLYGYICKSKINLVLYMIKKLLSKVALAREPILSVLFVSVTLQNN